MGIITPEKLCEIADAAAFEFGRPWRVMDLREKARDAQTDAEGRASSLGLPDEQATEVVRGYVSEQVKRAALPPDREKPKPEQIELAVETFTVEQWIALIDALDHNGTAALRSHIQQDEDGLKHRHGARKIERIVRRAIMRGNDLWLAENRDKMVPISDPNHAAVWREQARQANLEGRGRAANGRSIAEQASYRAIARRLTKRDEQTGREMKVSRDEVKSWRERMERRPFEKFVADKTADEVASGAAFIEYWTMIRTKHQRKN